MVYQPKSEMPFFHGQKSCIILKWQDMATVQYRLQSCHLSALVIGPVVDEFIFKITETSLLFWIRDDW